MTAIVIRGNSMRERQLIGFLSTLDSVGIDPEDVIIKSTSDNKRNISKMKKDL